MARWILNIVFALACVVAHQENGLSQEPPKRDPVALDQLPLQAPTDDPVMRAILERSIPIPSHSAETSVLLPRTSGKSNTRWRIAERLLKQARLMERDADSLEALGDQGTAMELRSIAQTTRNQVLRIFKSLETKSLP